MTEAELVAARRIASSIENPLMIAAKNPELNASPAPVFSTTVVGRQDAL